MLLILMPLPQLSAMAIFSPVTALGVISGVSLRLSAFDADDASDDNGGGKSVTLPATVTVVALWHASGLGHFRIEFVELPLRQNPGSSCMSEVVAPVVVLPLRLHSIPGRQSAHLNSAARSRR